MADGGEHGLDRVSPQQRAKFNLWAKSLLQSIVSNLPSDVSNHLTK
jgi:hypothetical protein